MKLDAKPAILGGDPIFSPALPMAKPRLPRGRDLSAQFESIVDSGHLTKGQHLAEFEEASRIYLGVDHALGVSSCTSGLMLCLQALKRRQNGAAVKIAVPSFTFLASLTAIDWAGLEPVFVDVDPETMNLCLDDLEKVLQKEEIAAVLAVHCFGNPVPRDEIERLTSKYNALLLFDAAHGFGSIHEKKKVGIGGWCQVFSLTPTKMVVAGEGGIIATNDGDLAQELRVGREYGNDGTYDTLFPGLNARLSELHACLATASLNMLEEVVAHRNQMACHLTGALSEIPGVGFQKITPNSRTTYKDFTISIDPDTFGLSRDRIADALLAEGIPTRKYFSPACHQHRAFQQFSTRTLPGTEQLSSRCLSLPLLEKDSVEGIKKAFQRIQRHGRQVGERS